MQCESHDYSVYGGWRATNCFHKTNTRRTTRRKQLDYHPPNNISDPGSIYESYLLFDEQDAPKHHPIETVQSIARGTLIRDKGAGGAELRHLRTARQLIAGVRQHQYAGERPEVLDRGSGRSAKQHQRFAVLHGGANRLPAAGSLLRRAAVDQAAAVLDGRAERLWQRRGPAVMSRRMGSRRRAVSYYTNSSASSVSESGTGKHCASGFSTKTLFSITQQLSQKPRQFITSLGFSFLIHHPVYTCYRRTCALWIYSHMELSPPAFKNKHGQTLPIDRRHVQAISWLPAGEKKIKMGAGWEQQKAEEELALTIFGCRNTNFLNESSIAEKYVELASMGDQITQDNMMKLAKCYLLLAAHVCLVPSPRKKGFRKAVFCAINDLENALQYDWSGFIMDDICRAAQAAKEVDVKKPHKVVCLEGCLSILQAMYFSCVIPRQFHVQNVRMPPIAIFDQPTLSSLVKSDGDGDCGDKDCEFGRLQFGEVFAFPLPRNEYGHHHGASRTDVALHGVPVQAEVDNSAIVDLNTTPAPIQTSGTCGDDCIYISGSEWSAKKPRRPRHGNFAKGQTSRNNMTKYDRGSGCTGTASTPFISRMLGFDVNGGQSSKGKDPMHFTANHQDVTASSEHAPIRAVTEDLLNKMVTGSMDYNQKGSDTTDDTTTLNKNWLSLGLTSTICEGQQQAVEGNNSGKDQVDGVYMVESWARQHKKMLILMVHGTIYNYFADGADARDLAGIKFYAGINRQIVVRGNELREQICKEAELSSEVCTLVWRLYIEEELKARVSGAIRTPKHFILPQWPDYVIGMRPAGHMDRMRRCSSAIKYHMMPAKARFYRVLYGTWCVYIFDTISQSLSVVDPALGPNDGRVGTKHEVTISELKKWFVKCMEMFFNKTLLEPSSWVTCYVLPEEDYGRGNGNGIAMTLYARGYQGLGLYPHVNQEAIKAHKDFLLEGIYSMRN
ncbi:hypothetical protein ACP70R_022322 [Stipagrostis hirtigluma subsp. patula]